MNYGNAHFQSARNAGKTWLHEQLKDAADVVMLEQMVLVVQQFILMKTGRRIKIKLSINNIDATVDGSHKELQLLGRAYDIATE